MNMLSAARRASEFESGGRLTTLSIALIGVGGGLVTLGVIIGVILCVRRQMCRCFTKKQRNTVDVREGIALLPRCNAVNCDVNGGGMRCAQA